MSKADQLGTGRSFGQVGGRGRSARGRAKAVTQGDLPTYELVRLHLEEVSPTPLNPRRNFGTEAELTRFGEELRQAQLAACVAVTRGAYLALWPDHEDRIGSAKHVLVNGERRYRSANQVGLDALDFVVRDDLASSREQFINHLLKENLEREDFDVIERARGVQQLVDVCAEESERGARARAAEQLGKDRSWVTNQLALLELPEELQAMLSAGSLAERDGRLLARHLKDTPELDAAALLEHLEQSKAQAAAAKEQDRAALEAARKASANITAAPLLSADNNGINSDDDEAETKQPTALLSADNKQSEQASVASAGKTSADLLSADNKPSGQTNVELKPAKQSDVPPGTPSSDTSSPLPAPRHDGTDDTTTQSDQGGGKQPRLLPYDNPFYIVQHLQAKMTPDDFVKCGRFWLKALGERHPDHFSALLKELTDQQQPS
ncbi:ParB/RepB/Spo0J family partition protein [Streptomyces sp. NPDC091217]|uniref:ParB/RepB/Spo0J family partition protein n=1 Tax=Streptomyces sp. NPDC091217 TaxID=3365975 RepID=UPI0037F9636B